MERLSTLNVGHCKTGGPAALLYGTHGSDFPIIDNQAILASHGSHNRNCSLVPNPVWQPPFYLPQIKRQDRVRYEGLQKCTTLVCFSLQNHEQCLSRTLPHPRDQYCTALHSPMRKTNSLRLSQHFRLWIHKLTVVVILAFQHKVKAVMRGLQTCKKRIQVVKQGCSLT